MGEEEEAKEGSQNEILELFERMKKELEERKRETDRLAKLLSDENEKRIHESEAIHARLEREKEELRKYLEEDNNKLLESVKAQAEKQAQEAKLLQDAMDREKAEMAERMEALQNHIKEDSSKFSEGNE